MNTVLKINGVIEVERVRIRRAGNRYFADLTVGLARNVTFQRSGQVVAEITDAVHTLLPDCDVVVHSVPPETGHESIFDPVRAVAPRNNFSRPHVTVHGPARPLSVEPPLH